MLQLKLLFILISTKTEIKSIIKTFYVFNAFFRYKKLSSRHSWMPSRAMPCYTLEPGNKHHDHKMRYE